MAHNPVSVLNAPNGKFHVMRISPQLGRKMGGGWVGGVPFLFLCDAMIAAGRRGGKGEGERMGVPE